MASLCRVCATASVDAINVFGEGNEEYDIVNKIHTYLPIRITEEDLLPITICFTCVDKLELCHEFVITCLEADSKLKQMLGFDPDDEEEREIVCKTEMYEEEEPEAYDDNAGMFTDDDDLTNGGTAYKFNNPHGNSTEILEVLPHVDGNVESERDMIFQCVYCESVLIGKEQLIMHQIAMHPDKVFTCTLCEPNLIFYESKHIYEQHMSSRHPKHDGNTVDDDTVLKKCEETLTNLNNGDASNILEKARDSNAMIIVEENGLIDDLIVNECDQLNTVKSLAPYVQVIEESEIECYKRNVAAKTNPNIKKKIVQSIKRKLANSALRQGKLNSEGHALSLRERNKVVKILRACPKCDRTFYSKKCYLLHKATHETGQKLMCEFCGKVFAQKHRLVNHLDIHNKGSLFPCNHCDKICATNKSLLHHKRCVHSDKSPFLCDMCGKNIKNLADFKLHQQSHIDPERAKRYQCDVCGKSFRKRSLLTEHKYHHTNEKPYQCPDCPKMFRTRNLLRQHSTVHLSDRKYQCTICNKQFRRKGNMCAHARTHEEFSSSSQGRTYMCNVCNVPFESLENLYTHRSQHSREEIAAAKAKKDSVLHECEICGKILQTKVTLQNHMMLHSGDIRCDECGKTFVSKRSLEVHYRLHTGEKPFICNYCGEGFITKSILVIHERIHTGELPFKCNICGKAFRSSTGLIPHKKIHSEIRPFGCETCNRRFKRKDALEAHIRIHTGERPYICQLCGRGFKQRTDCKKHEATHYNYNRPTFPCSYCKKFFKSASSLNEHVKSYHNMEHAVKPESEESNVIVESTEFIISEDSLAKGEPIILEAAEFIISESVEVVTEGEEPLTILDTNF